MGVGEPRTEEWTVRVQTVVTKVTPVAIEPAYVTRANPAVESAVKAASQGRCGYKCEAGHQRERKRRENAFHLRSPSRGPLITSALYGPSKWFRSTSKSVLTSF